MSLTFLYSFQLSQASPVPFLSRFPFEVDSSPSGRSPGQALGPRRRERAAFATPGRSLKKHLAPRVLCSAVGRSPGRRPLRPEAVERVTSAGAPPPRPPSSEGRLAASRKSAPAQGVHLQAHGMRAFTVKLRRLTRAPRGSREALDRTRGGGADLA